MKKGKGSTTAQDGDVEEDFVIGTSKEFRFQDTPLYKQVVTVTEGLVHEMIPAEYVQMIAEALPEDAQPETVYDEKFSLRDELSIQMKFIHALRNEVFDKNGKLRKNYGLDEAKQILTASRDLIKILQNSHDQLLSHDRMQAIELAFTDVVMKMPLEQREEYAEQLKIYLEQYDPG